MGPVSQHFCSTALSRGRPTYLCLVGPLLEDTLRHSMGLIGCKPRRKKLKSPGSVELVPLLVRTEDQTNGCWFPCYRQTLLARVSGLKTPPLLS